MSIITTTIYVPPQDARSALAQIRHRLMTCDPHDADAVHECLLDVVAFLQASVQTQEVR